MMASRRPVIITMTLLIFVINVTGNQRVACPNHLMRQKISCAPGQALSELTWSEDIPNCRKIHVECKNATTSCIEHCEWSPSCGTGGNLELEYVRGVDFLYDMMEEKQMVMFLCCHSEDVKTATIECDTSTKYDNLDGKYTPSKDYIMVKALTDADSGNLPMKVTFCPIVHVPTCPSVKSDIPQLDIMPDGSGLAGLSGLAGIAGLALLKPICFPFDFVLAGYDLDDPPWISEGGYATLGSCIARCRSDSKCLYAVYDGVSVCYPHFGPTRNVFPVKGWATYIKICLYDAIHFPLING